MSQNRNTAEREAHRFFLSVTQAGRSLFQAFLNGARTPERLIKTRRKLRVFANTESDKIESDVDRMPEPQRTQLTKACRVGCAHCCHFRVIADIPEMLAIGHHLHNVFTEDQRTALRERIRKYREQMIPYHAPNSVLGRAPCPFLVDDQCSIYEVRPFVCQRHHSTNLEPCIISRFEPEKRVDIPYVMPHIYLFAHLGLGIRKEIFDAGLDTSTVEVGVAAEVVLDHPDAFEKYFSGQDIFAEARIEVPEPVNLPRPEEV